MESTGFFYSFACLFELKDSTTMITTMITTMMECYLPVVYFELIL